MHRVQRRRRDGQQLIRLPVPQDLVDLPDQRIGADKFSLGPLDRDQQGIELLGQFLALGNDLGVFGCSAFFLGDRPQGGNLFAQRFDPTAVDVPRRVEFSPERRDGLA